MANNLHLTLACGDYDRTRALAEGTIRPDGIDLTYLRLPVEQTFFRMLRHREFEVAEMSLASYLVSLQQPEPPFVALPVFTSRMFRHSSVYINRDSGIERAQDLRGRVVGTPEFQLSACVWVRGILQDHHNLPADAVSYRTGGQESAGRVEKARLELPERFDVHPVPADRTLAQMLVDGEIDALYTPRIPSPFVAGDPRVGRLFEDVVATEATYHRKTGIFPIMHVVVIRRDVYERHRWVAQSLYKAFLEAKDDAMERLYDSSALRFMLPWLNQQLEQAHRELGVDYWSYGLAGNEPDLAAFIRYHHEQGLSQRQLDPHELFAPESLESAVI